MNVQLILGLQLINSIYHFDEMRVTQILINLITNAIKFSKKNSVVQINVSSKNLVD